MTDEERKDYDKFISGVRSGIPLKESDYKFILAADAELKRLREAVDALQANLHIFIHAHESGNSVPIFVVKDAEECCRRAKEG